eukprot:8137205-Lingulodinium_polyedra.AAC.1
MEAKLSGNPPLPAVPMPPRAPQLVGTVELDAGSSPLKVARIAAGDKEGDTVMASATGGSSTGTGAPPPPPVETLVFGGGGGAPSPLELEVARLTQEIAVAESRAQMTA